MWNLTNFREFCREKLFLNLLETRKLQKSKCLTCGLTTRTIRNFLKIKAMNWVAKITNLMFHYFIWTKFPDFTWAPLCGEFLRNSPHPEFCGFKKMLESFVEKIDYWTILKSQNPKKKWIFVSIFLLASKRDLFITF